MRRQTASVFFLVLFSAVSSFAQSVPVSPGAAVPPVIRFSGTLAIAAGHVPVTFGLYREETGGEPLWAETQTLLVDAAGRYTGGARRDPHAARRRVRQRRSPLAGRRRRRPRPAAAAAAGERALRHEGGRRRDDRRQAALGLRAGGREDRRRRRRPHVRGHARAVVRAGTSGPPSPPGGSGAAGGAGTANFIGMFTDATTLGNSVIYQAPGG